MKGLIPVLSAKHSDAVNGRKPKAICLPIKYSPPKNIASCFPKVSRKKSKCRHSERCKWKFPPPWKIQCCRAINCGVLSTPSMGIEKSGLHLIPGLQEAINKMFCSFL